MEKLFQILGFDPTQMHVYQSLLELGRSSPSALAKQLRIPRTSAYYALDALTKRGLVEREEDGPRLIYSAKDPKALKLLVEQERAGLEEKERAADSLAADLKRTFRGENYRVPKMRFYGGTPEVEAMLFAETEKWHASMAERGNVFWGFQDHSFVEQFPKWLKYHWRVRDEKQEIKLFTNQSAIERKMKGKVERRNMRSGPPQLKFDTTLWICGDYIIMMMTRRKPHYAYEIQDEALAATMRSLFQTLWEIWQ